MSTKEHSRKFSFSYGELLQQALEKSTFLRRDAAELASRKVTVEELDTFDDMIIAFRETVEDVAFSGLITDAGQTRDEKRKQLEILGRDIVGIAESVFRDKAGILSGFGFTGLARMTDAELLLSAQTLYTRALQHESALEARGLTPAMISAFKDAIDALEPVVKYLVTAKLDREENTRNRYKISNTLYSKMSDLCLIATNYFRDRDAAKYSDYVIYGSSAASQSRSGTLKPQTIISRTFSALTPETEFKFKNEGEGPLDFYFSTTEGGLPITNHITVPPYQEHIHTAADLGYDVPTGIVKFNVRNVDESANSSYLVRIE